MTKRRDALKGYLTPIIGSEFSSENSVVRQRPQVTSGALQSMNEAISGLSKEADELRKALATGSVIVELDPSVIKGSFVKDRLDGYSGAEFDSLVASIAEQGQAIPVLVRPHPQESGHYQLAFGHRRVAALRVLNQPVKAFVRQMTDEELVMAQGSENLERKDLSFIERAMFAFRLEERGMSRAVIMSTFGTSSKGVLSEMISLARRLPTALVEAIGPASKIGRPRWSALADLLASKDSKIWRTEIHQPHFGLLSSDERFDLIFRLVSSKTRGFLPAAKSWSPDDQMVNVRKTVTDKTLAMNFSARDGKSFGEWISNNLEGLYESFRNEANKRGE